MQQLADLEEARSAYGESMTIRRQRLEDLADRPLDRATRSLLVQAERRCRAASRRAMRGSAGN